MRLDINANTLPYYTGVLRVIEDNEVEIIMTLRCRTGVLRVIKDNDG